MRLLATALVCAALSSCAITTPKYSTQPQNQSVLRNGGFQHAAVGPFTASDKDLESLTIRGNPLVPSSGTFSGDIRQALETELERAGLLSPDAATRITGTLQENELDGRGMSEGHASISVEFVVQRGDREVYRATKKADHAWPSSFIGAKAIPAASQGYVRTTEKLIAALVADAAFQEALK